MYTKGAKDKSVLPTMRKSGTVYCPLLDFNISTITGFFARSRLVSRTEAEGGERARAWSWELSQENMVLKPAARARARAGRP